MPYFSAVARQIYWVMLLAPAGPALAQAPAITSHIPLANGTAAASNSPVIIGFSQALTAGSAGGLKVFSSQRGGLRTLAAPAVVSGSTLRFAPNYPFLPGETVLSTVTTAAASGNGPLAQPQVSQFTVAVGGTGRGGFTVPATNAEVAVGTNPAGVVMGDVDGDGDLDLLASSYFNATVSLRLNNGRGSFTAPAANPEIALGATPAGVVLGDVDGDGDLDFVTANDNSGTVSVRFNNGTGGFSAPSPPNMAMGTSPQSVALGDVDGDGDLDLVTADLASNAVLIRFNNGTGSFAARAATPDAVVGTSPKAVVLGDVDADGDLDLLVVGATGTVNTRLNTGAGSFTTPAANAAVAVGPGSGSLAVGDVDGDGDLDLLTTGAINNTVSVRLNGGTVLAAGASWPAAAGSSFFPNPAHATVTAHLPAIPGATEATCLFHDVLGRVVRTQSLNLTANGTIADLDISSLAPGIYQVQVQAGGQHFNSRLAVE